MSAANFARLRVLHLENGVWVNRTDRTSVAPTLCTNNVKSLSLFVIVEVEAAFTGLVDQYMAEDTTTSFNFEVTDPETITSITATSSDPAVVANDPAYLSVSGSGTTRTVNVTPAANQNGEVVLTVTVTRGSTSLSDSITLTVTEVNDIPVPSNDTLSSVAEDSAQRTISFATLLGNDSPGPANESSQSLTLLTVSSPTGGTVSISGTDVLFTPAANFNGAASFSYTIRDNGTTDGAADPLTSTSSGHRQSHW
ncbi:MAG TPA: Ig-like domain-containing protein [Chthoniobacterales bacterium]|nr:Ig-like domain-containing protein [Chthoniobacterales bacterium]